MPASVRDGSGAQIVATFEVTFSKYLALDPGLALVLALWGLSTYLFNCFDTFPYLAITSPVKRCGKTRLAEILESLSSNAQRTVGITPAALFRTIERKKPTLIVDEAESLSSRSERAEALREILNAGYRKGQRVIRCARSEGDYEPREFETYCPKVLVLIGNPPDTLADRSIPIRMRRRTAGQAIERLLISQAMRRAARWRNEAARWADANRMRVIRRHRGQDLLFLQDREAELWLPLFTVCHFAAPQREGELKAIARQLAAVKESHETDELSVMLLRDIRDVFDRAGQDRLATTDLLLELSSIAESPWATWARGRGLDARGLARLLRPFRIQPHNLRLEEQIVKGYARDDFREAWASYVPPSCSRYSATESSESSDSDSPASATQR